jgi:hypothetical protein
MILSLICMTLSLICVMIISIITNADDIHSSNDYLAGGGVGAPIAADPAAIALPAIPLPIGADPIGAEPAAGAAPAAGMLGREVESNLFDQIYSARNPSNRSYGVHIHRVVY